MAAPCDNVNFVKGNEEFVAENYAKSAEWFSKAIDDDNSCSDFYAHRAHAYIKLQNYNDALNDCETAIKLNIDDVKSIYRKGIASFYLQRYSTALEAFTRCLQLDPENDLAHTWLQQCKAALPSQETSEDPLPEKTIPAPVVQKIKHDWYQTEKYVVVTVMLRNVKQEMVSVVYTENSIILTVKRESEGDYCLHLNLCHTIVPSQCLYKILSTKIEVKVKKAEGIRWEALEKLVDAASVKQFTATSDQHDDCLKYPSSSKKSHDWDKLAAEVTKEEKQDKGEGEAALNKLFQQIYGDGSDDVKRAMNKSFMESGGTVLSTNWGEIGTKKTEIKPPDGMEWKKWD